MDTVRNSKVFLREKRAVILAFKGRITRKLTRAFYKKATIPISSYPHKPYRVR